MLAGPFGTQGNIVLARIDLGVLSIKKRVGIRGYLDCVFQSLFQNEGTVKQIG